MKNYDIAHSELTNCYYIMCDGKKVADCTEQIANIRANEIIKVLEEVKSKMISFHTDAIFQYGADIIEARADAFDELKDWLKEQNNG